MSQNHFHFPRPAMAQNLADGLTGTNLLLNYSSGLFLSAPRRTGKTTFLIHDLTPELEKHKFTVVYVDLWSAPDQEPDKLIFEAIGRAIDDSMGVVSKVAKGTGLSEVTIAHTLKFNTSKIGQPDGSTIADAFKYLIALNQKPVVFIIDEAQQTLTSEKGNAVMFALKSARDQINKPGQPKLMLVMSGSDRDKLLRLVNGNSSPFLGSNIVPMPTLGKAYTDYLTDQLGKKHPDLAALDRQVMFDTFQLVGNRPEVLMGAITQVAGSLLSGPSPTLNEDLKKYGQEFRLDERTSLEADFLGLSILEQAILGRMLDTGDKFKPYNKAALDFYAKITGEPVEPNQVQAALDRMRSREEPLIWKSARSEYSVQNGAMKDWFTDHKASAAWPPAPNPAGTQRAKRTRRRSP